MNQKETILRFIKKFNQNIKIEQLFLNGYCYYFYIILKEKFPESVAYYDTKYQHIVTKIQESYYDIRGEVCTKNDYIKKENLIRWEHVPDEIKKIEVTLT